eukprot:scaffold6200_cov118-Cylindrotheca_fusiformis.AAC.7
MASISSFTITLIVLFAMGTQSFTFHHSCLPQIHSTPPSPSSSRRLMQESSSSSTTSSNIQFLGRGSNAIVRPGAVLLSPSEEFHHYLREAAIFIYAMGLDDNDVYVIRGAIIDHPTAFTIGEMMGESSSAAAKIKEIPILSNMLYRGGDSGGESIFMLHSDDAIAESANLEMIGNSGIYEGGFNDVLSASDEFDVDKAKFFFHYMEFTEQELLSMLVDPENGADAWTSVEVPPEIVMSCDYGRGDCWARLRNAVREY